MTPSRLLIATAGGVLSAIFYLAVALGPGGFVLPLFAQLPLFLVGLSLGVGPAAVAGTAGTLLILLMSSLATAGAYVALTAGAATLIVRQALLNRPAAQGGIEWYPPGLLLSWVSAAALGFLGIGALYASGAEDGLLGSMRQIVRGVISVLPPEQAARLSPVEDLIARFLPAAFLGWWIVLTAVNGVIAQGALAGFGRALRPSPAMADLWLPSWPGFAMIAAVAASFLPGEIGMLAENAMIILGVPFVFLGLGVLHALAGRIAARALFLAVLYVLLVLLGWPALIVAAIGFIEQWVGLRGRLAPPRDRENG